MITPRRTRLLRTSTLHAFQQAIVEAAASPSRPRPVAVIVPTGAAANQLRRTLAPAPRGAPPPDIVTRAAWYEWLCVRLDPVPSVLTVVEREVVATRAAREAIAAGFSPPFKLRPGLIPAFLAFYDDLGRYRRTTDAFERLVVEDLEPTAEVDRGAHQLLLQSRFLVAAFRAYERRRDARGAVDEQTLRAALLAAAPLTPTEVVVTIPDQAAHPHGLYPADFDLLARLPNLSRVTLVATDAVLDSGYRERLDDWLPGLDEERVDDEAGRPVLVVPEASDGPGCFVWRDREEELRAIAHEAARRARDDRRAPSTAAVVVPRPLPYLYLAPSAFDAYGVEIQAGDALPFATEPYVALVDLVFDVVDTDFSRPALVALLRSPHCTPPDAAGRLGRRVVQAFDRTLRASRFPGGVAALEARLSAGTTGRGSEAAARPALRAALALARELRPLGESRPVAEHLGTVRQFLERWGSGAAGASAPDRTSQARDLLQAGLLALETSHRGAGDPPDPVDLSHVRSIVRQWIERQVSPAAEPGEGVPLVDAEAAIYGAYDDVFIAGLVEGEWPPPAARNIFYPGGMLVNLGWPRERDRLRAARAAFRDLLGLSRARVWLSTFTFEDDAVVTISTALELVEELSWDRRPAPTAAGTDIDASAGRTGGSGAVVDATLLERWQTRRRARGGERDDARFHGVVGPHPPRRYAVSGLERYLECPFKYYARDVLRLEEDDGRDDDRSLTPQQRGLFLHEVFEAFFRHWQSAGRVAITLANLEDALACFAEVAEQVLRTLAPRDRAVARAWLLGSAASPGLAERMFVAEIEDPGDVTDRRLEYRIDGQLEVGEGMARRTVELRGVVDRIDLQAGQSFRVIDYKATRPPSPSRALQLPVYARCAEDQLRQERGETWRASDLTYIAFGDPRTAVSVSGRDIGEAIQAGARRVATVSAAIEAGQFPPRPADLFRCSFCPYPTVCRKDYVEET